MATAESHPAVTMDDVRMRMARVMQLLDQLVTDPHVASSNIAAKRSGANSEGE